jgi:hypothetical protein
MLAAPLDIDPRLADGRQSATALAVARGASRMLVALGFSVLRELPLLSGRRADIVALGTSGEIWIVEIKSSLEDFRADQKWPEYRVHCDRFFFAAPLGLDLAIFPEEAGLIVADAHGADILRAADEHRMAGATRKAITLRFASAAASRLHALWDPAARLPR